MTQEKKKVFFQFLIGALVGILGMYVYQNYNVVKKDSNKIESSTPSKPSSISNSQSIDALTEENLVVNFVKANKELPEYYMTKNEAKNLGWTPSKGNLCDVLPGKAIGGDNFSNREKTLPKGKYYEADVNYNCGNRNADRIVFNDNGEVWLTKNHYKTFEKQ
ncbi:ribonuclease domain-containing protein [Frigoriflavimonas asaccharolytica]|uniref:Ribonuclease n=1 Tax=Frigoriflavimonas asaccharolytica TaxID=2735899 RepID=A0A8J8GC55_9FLAO|nr:ribonuclease domain-containing protein [Frigoriflavimonas asaccharolytica]NRS93235.1 guanyl-specific ribonuclease Sa [Frigoriflavimonas asaccharolytica]